ncbi:MAG: DUF1579 domain-containing protein [Acidobacteriota bacterium]
MPSSFQAPSSNASISSSYRRPNASRILLWSVFLLIVLGLTAPSAQAQGEGDYADLAALVTPGEEHRAMAEEAGEFNYQSTLWMIPGQPPAVSEGESVRQVILDGRYIREDLTGDIMGQPFSGIGISGYDRVSKQYRSIWIDSMGTGMLSFIGTPSEEDERTVVYQGDFVNPMTQQNEAIRSVYTTVSADEQHFFYYVTAPGSEERLQMKIIYWRKGSERPPAAKGEPAAE